MNNNNSGEDVKQGATQDEKQGAMQDEKQGVNQDKKQDVTQGATQDVKHGVKKVKLISYLRPYWLIAMMAPLLMAGEVVADLYQPRLMAKIVNEGVLGGSMDVIIRTGILMVILLAAIGITGFAAAGFASAASQNFGNDLRKDVFERVMKLSLEQTDKFTTGSLVTRLTNDITAVQNIVAMSLRMFVRAPIMFAGGIVMALSLDLQFGIVFMCALPVQALLLWLILSKASPLFAMVQTKLDKVNSVVQENVAGARVVKAFVRGEYEKGRFAKANTELMETSVRVQKLLALMHPVMMIIMHISVMAVIFVGAFRINAGGMMVGSVMAAVSYLMQILMSIMMVTMMLQAISRAKASADRIREVLTTEPAIGDGSYIPVTDTKVEGGDDTGTAGASNRLNAAAARGASVEFSGVSFTYPGFSGEPILKDISLRIDPGETIAILGSTGSGKSTLVNLIPRFYEADAGNIKVDGIGVREYDLESLRGKIGFVLQKSELFTGSIKDNILWGDEDADDEAVFEAAGIAQADGFIREFVEGYNTVIGEKGASLSGGQKQRLAIARAILRKPSLLIFDDSTSALDLGTESRLQKALRESLGNTTVIFIAQRVASIKNADRIVVLENGKIAAVGTHQELLAGSRVYIDIYDSQMKREAAE